MRHVLAVIPARGGSKSIPLKNIKPLAGKPLLAYTIEAAKQSHYLDRYVVSTDHDEIAKVAAGYGADVVHRPPEYATDDAPTELALLHAVDSLKQAGYRPHYVVTLEPTSPFRTAELIDRCIELAMKRDDADCVMTVTETRKCYGRIVEGRFEYLFPGQPRRRQDRTPLYEESSTVYVTRTSALERYRSVVGVVRYVVVVDDPRETIDINEQFDFMLAEAALAQGGLGDNHG